MKEPRPSGWFTERNEIKSLNVGGRSQKMSKVLVQYHAAFHGHMHFDPIDHPQVFQLKKLEMMSAKMCPNMGRELLEKQPPNIDNRGRAGDMVVFLLTIQIDWFPFRSGTHALLVLWKSVDYFVAVGQKLSLALCCSFWIPLPFRIWEMVWRQHCSLFWAGVFGKAFFPTSRWTDGILFKLRSSMTTMATFGWWTVQFCRLSLMILPALFTRIVHCQPLLTRLRAL